MSRKRNALINLTGAIQIADETYNVVGAVTDPKGIYAEADFIVGDVIFDSSFFGNFRWTIIAINSAGGGNIDCDVRWDDEGNPPFPGVGPAAGVGAICGVSANGMAYAPSIEAGAAYGYTEDLATSIKNMDLSRASDSESDKEEELLYNLLGETAWANHLVFDVFLNETRRDPFDPYVHRAYIHGNLLKSGTVPSRVFGWATKKITLPEVVGKVCLTAEYDISAGSGNATIKVSLDNGANYTTILDTAGVINKLNEEVDIINIGQDVIIAIELTTDVSGVGGFFRFFGAILG